MLTVKQKDALQYNMQSKREERGYEDSALNVGSKIDVRTPITPRFEQA